MPSHPLMLGESRSASPYGVGRPGDAETDPHHLVVLAAAFAEQRVQAFGDVRHQFIGSDADLLINIGDGQHLAGQIADTELGSASADGGSQHDAGVGVEGQSGRGAAPVDGASARSTTKPASCSADTRAATAVRESPVRRPASARVVTAPSRISSNTSPAVAGAGEDREVRISAIQPTSYCTYNNQCVASFNFKMRK